MNDISEARKCDSTLSQRKSRTLSAPTTPTGPAEMRSGGPVEKSQATAVAVPSKRSMQTSSRSTTQVTSKVTPKSQDSQVPVKMNDGRDIVAVASARTEIVGKSVEAPAANADEVDKAVNAGTMVGETSVVVAKASDYRTGAPDGGMGQNRCAYRGGGVTANWEKTGPKRSTGSTFPRSFYRHRIAAYLPWATRDSREQIQRERPVPAPAALPTWSAAPHHRQRQSAASRHVPPGLQLAAGLRGPACELRTRGPHRRVPHAVARGAEDVLHALLSPVL
ncbi:uncharacterized protein [Dermacentor albipictus]|uniref:uncharacterized protein isoform X2 n=1 Tax=Dermacentor albipictus TaxID=60249 RepID=UPI0038FC9282